MKTKALLILLLLELSFLNARAAYSLFLASEGAAGRNVQVGESFKLDIILVSDGSDVHNSAIFRLIFSAPGLFYDSYSWNPPYSNGTAEDDSKPLHQRLPLRLEAKTLSGIGYAAGVVDVELSNVTGSQPGFGAGILASLILSVPLDYAGPTNITVTAQPDSFANGFDIISTAASNNFVVTIEEHNSALRPLVQTGAGWRYLDGGSDAGAGWRQINFNDASWSNGIAKLGYGHGDETTVVRYGDNPRNKHVTTYFRKSFLVANASNYVADPLNLRVRREDGIVVYLNGTEVSRDNMPAGAASLDTLASAAAPDGGQAWVADLVDPGLLITGTNVVAAEVHLADRGAPTMTFDLELYSVGCVSRRLMMLQRTNDVRLVLPCAAYGYRLEEADTLAPPIAWRTITNPPIVNGSLRTLLLPVANTGRFFRLTKP